MKTAFICNERYFWHDNGPAVIDVPSGGYLQPHQHVESPESRRRLRNLIEACGLSDELAAIPLVQVTEDDLLRFHTPDYLNRLKQASDSPGQMPFGDATFVGNGSYDIALLSVAGVVSGFTAVLNGQVENAYCLVRPPGHHAEPDRAMGFCLLGNIPIAIMHAQHGQSLGKVAVVDWDVHHGNGTEKAFYHRSDVLTISIHQDRNYPLETGLMEHTGSGDGKGFNINIPLPPGSGAGAYYAAIDQIVLPAIHRFEPELIVIASGYDASMFDPLGRQMLFSSAYRTMTHRIMECANAVCSGRVVVVHEGGYSEAYVPFCGLAVIEALSGVDTDVSDPFETGDCQSGYQSIQPAQQDVVNAVRELHAV